MKKKQQQKKKKKNNYLLHVYSSLILDILMNLKKVSCIPDKVFRHRDVTYEVYFQYGGRQRDSLMATPTLKSNAGDQKVCKKKNLSCFFGADRKIRPSRSLFGITQRSLVMPNIDPRADFSIRTSHPWKIIILLHTG